MINLGKIYMLTLLFLSLLSCGNNSVNNNEVNSYWDSSAHNFYMPTLGLVYHVPNPEQSLLASTTNISREILMCVIDTVTCDCITVLDLDPDNAGSNYSIRQLEYFVRKIVEQDSSVKSEIIGSKISPAKFMDENAWRFDTSINIFTASDTFSVSYAGFIFDRNNGPKAIVLTSNQVSESAVKLEGYISGFNEM